MYAGLAGGLLVFTGLWHATEWMMDGRRGYTWRLVPVGLLYLVLGGLLVMETGGKLIQLVALLGAVGFGSIAFLRRDQIELRRWVTWAFLFVDLLIAVSLILALLS